MMLCLTFLAITKPAWRPMVGGACPPPTPALGTESHPGRNFPNQEVAPIEPKSHVPRPVLPLASSRRLHWYKSDGTRGSCSPRDPKKVKAKCEPNGGGAAPCREAGVLVQAAAASGPHVWPSVLLLLTHLVPWWAGPPRGSGQQWGVAVNKVTRGPSPHTGTPALAKATQGCHTRHQYLRCPTGYMNSTIVANLRTKLEKSQT